MAKSFTEEELKGVFEKCSNWGRWGKDDERGALNFITDKKRATAGKARGTVKKAIHAKTKTATA